MPFTLPATNSILAWPALPIATIIEEAHAVGLKVFAIPSRWCGLIAGWPMGAGHFTASRPDVWMLKEDGSPMIKPFCGPLASVFHPEVKQHMVAITEAYDAGTRF